MQVARLAGSSSAPTPMWIERKVVASPTVSDDAVWIDVTPAAPETAAIAPVMGEVAAFRHDEPVGGSGLDLDGLGAPPALEDLGSAPGAALPAAALLPGALLPEAAAQGGCQCVGGNCDVPPLPGGDDDA